MIPEFAAPDFVNENDVDTIHARMLKELPSDLDHMPGGFIWDFTRPTALEKSRLIQYTLINALKLMFPMWAWGEWLDYHAGVIGLKRREPGYASGELTIHGSEGTEIAAGSIFVTPATNTSSSIEFQVNQDYVIGSQGVMTVDITAVAPGINSNVSAKTITLLQKPIEGIVKVYNDAPVTGGTDQEDDETLRLRIQEYNEAINTSFVGNNSDYIRWAKEVQGVGNVTVIPEWDGPGTVKLVILDSNGQPANDYIINQVYDYIMQPSYPISRKAPIGAILTVAAPDVIRINYKCDVTLYPGYQLDEVIIQFKEKLQSYYEIAKDEGILVYTKLCSLLSETAGIKDYSNFTINETVTNIILDQDVYPETSSVDFKEV